MSNSQPKHPLESNLLFYCHSTRSGEILIRSVFYCLWINFQLLVQFMTFLFFSPQNPSASTYGRNDIKFHTKSEKQIVFVQCRSNCIVFTRIMFSFLFLLVIHFQYRQKDFDSFRIASVQKGMWKLMLMKFDVFFSFLSCGDNVLFMREPFAWHVGGIKHSKPSMLFLRPGKNLIKPKRDRSRNSVANILILNDTAGATTQAWHS